MDFLDRVNLLLVRKRVRDRYLSENLPEWSPQERKEIEEDPSLTLKGWWVCRRDDPFRPKDYSHLRDLKEDHRERGRGCGYPPKVIEYLKEVRPSEGGEKKGNPRPSMKYSIVVYEWDEDGSSECGEEIFGFIYRDYSLAQWFLDHTKDWVPVLKEAGFAIEYSFIPS